MRGSVRQWTHPVTTRVSRVDADDLQEVVALCDEDGILLSWNKAGEDVTGFSQEDVVGYHMDAIVAPARATR